MDVGKIFFKLGENEKISRDELYSYGASDEYIEKAIENDVLRQVDDYYVSGDVDALVEYSDVMLEKNDSKTSASIINCAYAKDFNNYNVNLRLLYRTIASQTPKKYRVYKYFTVVYDKLVECGKRYDANYYLFMIGSLFGLADGYEKLYEKFNMLEEKDILLPDVNKETHVKNSLRKSIFGNSYYETDRMYDIVYNQNSFDERYEDTLEKKLVLRWKETKRYINRKLSDCLSSNNIEEAKKLLDKEDDKRSLSKTNEYILRLVNSYLTIQETGIIPKVKYEGNNAFDAIIGNNYKLALELETNHIKAKGIKKETYLYIMLKKIVGLIDSIDVKEEKNVQEEVVEVKEVTPIKEELPKKKVTLTDKEKQSLDSKFDAIYKGRMVFLLEPMSQEKRDAVRDYIRIAGNYDISSFSVGIEPERRIVLRYKPFVTERVDLKATLEDARAFYASADYDLAAEYYEMTLKIGKPKEATYGGYGMTLYKLGRRKEALDCLKIATIMSKTEGDGKIDYTDIIDRIEHPVERENRKPRVVVNESEFEDKNEFNDDIINTLVGLYAEGEINLFDTCKKLNLSEEDTNYVKLIYARDCYYLGNNNEGDKYFKQVEKSKAKDKKVKDLYKEILVNKKYYHNRLDSHKNQIVFIKK